MCNTRSNVYLQSMKTYTLSVNTLMRNLSSERHDNCAPCLGLILPIWWVTPPPNLCLKYFIGRLICKVFAFNSSSTLILLHVYLHYIDLVLFGYINIFAFCPLQHSLIAMSSRWIFWTKWMWSDPNLSMLLSQVYLSKSYAFYWNCQMSLLHSCQQKI